MDNPPIDDEGEGKEEEEQENEIEVNVQISDTADTLQNRFSVVILDVKEKNGRCQDEGALKKGGPQDSCEQERNYEDIDKAGLRDETAVQKEEENFDEISLEEKRDGKERSNEEEASKMRKKKERSSELEIEIWRKGVRLSLLTCIYVSYSIWGCMHVFLVLINILVGLSRNAMDIQPALIVITYVISSLIFVTVWAVFQLRQTLHRQWFVRSLWISWITSVFSTLYIVISIVMSKASASTGFTIFLFCCVVGSSCALSITSVVTALHLTASALIDCPTSTCASYLPTFGKVKRNDNAWQTKGKTDNVKDAPSWNETFNFRGAYRWSIVLFVISCFSIPVGGAIAIHACNVFKFFAFSFVILIMPSIISGIVIHVQEKKSKFLWLAFLWMSVLGLLITIVRIFVIVSEIANERSCKEGYSKTWYKVLNVSLLVLVLIKVVCLAMMTKTAVHPLRNQGSKEDVNVTEQQVQRPSN